MDNLLPNIDSIFKNDAINTTEEFQFRKRCAHWFKIDLSEQINRFLSKQKPDTDTPPDSTKFEVGDDAEKHKACFKAVKTVAEMMAANEHVSLTQIADGLQAKNCLASIQSSSYSSLQACFLFAGWLTMLYEADMSPKPDMLAIRSRSIHSLTRPRFRKRPSYTTDELNTENASLPLYYLFPRLGDILPLPVLNPVPEWKFMNNSNSLYSDALILSNFNFYALNGVGHVSIRWTRSLAQHLDFDDKSRVLKLFMYPSYCGLICTSDPSSTSFLNCLIANDLHSEELTDSSVSRSDGDIYQWTDFCREILVSYGLIFGQDKWSRKNFRSKIKYWTKSELRPQHFSDPLLKDICSNSWRDHILYDILDAPAVKASYSASKDFPFLGKKLLSLQEYMNAQNPSDLKFLLHDRRDILRFYTFWAVTVIGLLSVVLSFAQTVIAAGSLIAGFWNS